MTQTVALFVDAYRELNAQRMFWYTTVFSALVACIFAMIGIDEQGISFLHWHVISQVNTSTLSPAALYKTMFVEMGIKWWLAWAATIMGLVATASIFPNFTTGGAIDLVLSKPIGRVRLFLTKYATGLLFVTLQVTAFTLVCFLVIGFRGGVWEPWLFLAVPLVVCFFSYLFAVCTLLGILTHSTIAALLLTILFWVLLAILSGAQTGITSMRLFNENVVQRLEQRQAAMAPGDVTDEMKKELAKQKESLEAWQTADHTATVIRTFAPKTSETIDLLSRKLVALASLPEAAEEETNPSFGNDQRGMRNPAFGRQVAEERRKETAGWILGTSLAFEAACLALAAWVFKRRDF